MKATRDSSQKTNTPQSQTKAGKSWMICTIILALVLVVGGAFAASIIAKGNRDTNKLSEVEAQLKEKDQKISELEKAQSANEPETPKTTGETIEIDFAGLKKLTSTDGGKATLSIGKLELTKDGKYIYAIGGVGSEYGSYAGVWYKSTKNGAGWKVLQNNQAIGSCTLYSDEAKAFMKEYKYIDDDLPSKYLGCREADGSIFPE